MIAVRHSIADTASSVQNWAARTELLKWLRKPWMPVLFASLLTAVLAGRGISGRALSFDEFFSLTAVTTDLRSGLAEVPLLPYYAVLWVWTFGGEVTNDGWLRALSLVSVVVAAAVTVAFAVRLAGVRVAYLAAVLFALNPGISFAAQDARPYALGLAFFAGASYALVRALDRQQRRLWWAFAVLLLIGVVLAPNGVIVLLPLLWLLRGRYPHLLRCRALFLSLLPVAILIIAGVALLASGSFSAMREWLPSPQLLWLPTGAIWAAIGESEFVGAPHGFAAALLLLTTLSAAGRRVLWGSLLAVLLVWVFSQGPSSFWIGRAFITLIPLITVAAALGLTRISRRGLVAALVVLLILAVPGYTAVRLPREGYADLRLAAQIIERESEDSDQIFGNGYLGQGLQYELAVGVDQYGTSEPVWEVTREPTRPFWILYDDYPCDETFSIDVRGGVELRRCAAPS